MASGQETAGSDQMRRWLNSCLLHCLVFLLSHQKDATTFFRISHFLSCYWGEWWAILERRLGLLAFPFPRCEAHQSPDRIWCWAQQRSSSWHPDKARTCGEQIESELTVGLISSYIRPKVAIPALKGRLLTRLGGKKIQTWAVEDPMNL